MLPNYRQKNPNSWFQMVTVGRFCCIDEHRHSNHHANVCETVYIDVISAVDCEPRFVFHLLLPMVLLFGLCVQRHFFVVVIYKV